MTRDSCGAASSRASSSSFLVIMQQRSASQFCELEPEACRWRILRKLFRGRRLKTSGTSGTRFSSADERRLELVDWDLGRQRQRKGAACFRVQAPDSTCRSLLDHAQILSLQELPRAKVCRGAASTKVSRSSIRSSATDPGSAAAGRG